MARGMVGLFILLIPKDGGIVPTLIQAAPRIKSPKQQNMQFRLIIFT
mgnify:CR=1 FL=1